MRQKQGFAPQKQPSDAGGRTSGQYSRPIDISVLILGPNGAGKESVAQRIHYIGERKDMPFVAVNCGVIPKELAPSLFFGHIKGTFTGADANKDGYFEVAKGGTLFLDEIGILSLDVQAMLLRVCKKAHTSQ